MGLSFGASIVRGLLEKNQTATVLTRPRPAVMAFSGAIGPSGG